MLANQRFSGLFYGLSIWHDAFYSEQCQVADPRPLRIYTIAVFIAFDICNRCWLLYMGFPKDEASALLY
ncbi:hypothetical protein ACFQMJ_11910 [Cohnella cellulosilytica]|uniref:Uncharacterized protein n=1 Tax=Cohnella cellulosilytica TaxID=986710 RepID=A0ABW2FCG7_9BACL